MLVAVEEHSIAGRFDGRPVAAGTVKLTVPVTVSRRRDLPDTLARVETEMGTHHGYAFSDRGNLHEAAREKHYERMLALFRRHIG